MHGSQSGVPDLAQLERRAAALETRLRTAGKLNELHLQLELAGTLHALNQASPDGNTRVGRAAELYRSVAANSENPLVKMSALSSLASLLLSAQDTEGALQAARASDAFFEQAALKLPARSAAERLHASNALNAANALQIRGDSAEAAVLLRERVLTAEVLQGFPSLWAKVGAGGARSVVGILAKGRLHHASSKLFTCHFRP